MRSSSSCPRRSRCPTSRASTTAASPTPARRATTQPFAALAFKILNDPFVGNLTFFRVYSGTLNSGDTVYVPTKGKKERIGRLLQMHASERTEIKEVRAGDIAAAVGLKDVITGDTLCDLDKDITLEKMVFPEPVISVAIEPKTKADQEKMGIALQRLAKEDPSFRVHTDQESGQTIISGMGELHLEIIVDRMKREFKVEANVGKPQVAYRETIRGKVETRRQVHPPVRRPRPVRPRVAEARAATSRARASSSSTASSAAPSRASSFRRSTRASRKPSRPGVIAGYPVVDVKVTLFDGSYHDVDSNEMAFKIAGSMGFKDGFRAAKPVLLEPIMKVEVVTPEEYIGRRHRRPEPPARADHRHGRARAARQGRSPPRCRCRRCSATRRPCARMSQGRATFTMEFAHYVEVPPNIADGIIKKSTWPS